jgi:hypothetical protein
MSKPIRLIAVLLICAVLLPAAGSSILSASAAPLATSPNLGAAASYSVLAGSEVTNTGPTHVYGNVGVATGTSITGFNPPGTVGPPGTIHSNDSSANDAQTANTDAFNALGVPQCDFNYASGQDLSALSPLVPGVYCTEGSFALTQNLTLTGSGVWIFKSGSTLITSTGSSVTGDDSCNVWWRVGSSATLGDNTQFIGNILASAAITMDGGASLKGRALAKTAVTMINNTISACSSPTAIAMREFQATSAAGSPIGLGAGAGLLLALGLIVIRRRAPATPNAAPSARQGDGK